MIHLSKREIKPYNFDLDEMILVDNFVLDSSLMLDISIIIFRII